MDGPVISTETMKGGPLGLWCSAAADSNHQKSNGLLVITLPGDSTTGNYHNLADGSINIIIDIFKRQGMIY